MGDYVLGWETRENHRRVKRSVEKHYSFYDGPDRIFEIINCRTWPYSSDNRLSLNIRDLAYMCLLYMGSFRASELCRANLPCGYKPSVNRNQFIIERSFIKLRDTIILKRREPVLGSDGNQVYDEKGKPVYQPIQSLDHYDKREEIKIPRRGNLSKFSYPIVDYLEKLDPYDELFPFKYIRGFQIVDYCTTPVDRFGNVVLDEKKIPMRGVGQHYLRDMGLKLHSRLVNRNIKDLQNYSGHKRLENLTKYLGEGSLEDAYLKYKPE